MTLVEAIEYHEEVAERNEMDSSFYEISRRDATKSEICKQSAEEHRQIAGWLRELKQLREQTRWIPVSERLPKKGQRVLVKIDNYAHIAEFSSISGYDDVEKDIFIYNIFNPRGCYWDVYEVSEWMPILE